MNRSTLTRIGLGYLAVQALTLGVWALFSPQTFYDTFPGLGRTWVSIDGPYNEHLVRDVGALNLALLVLLGAAIRSLDRTLIIVAALASLVWGVPHVVYHALNTDGLDGLDIVGNLGGLAIAAAIPAMVLWVWRGGVEAS